MSLFETENVHVKYCKVRDIGVFCSLPLKSFKGLKKYFIKKKQYFIFNSFFSFLLFFGQKNVLIPSLMLYFLALKNI